MLDQVTSMRVFVRVAAAGSLARAGRELQLSQTMVTRHIEEIERRIGVRLLHRTTRRLSLTEAGRSFLDASQRILADIDQAEASITAGTVEARGTLRLNLPISFGVRQVMPALPTFTARHPAVEVDVGLTDRIVDLPEEGWDLAIRVGRLSGAGLSVRKLAPCRSAVAAAPDYLARRGTPQTVAALAGHSCLGYTLSDTVRARRWLFGRDGRHAVDVSGPIRGNNGDALVAAAIAGAGIVYQPTFLLADAVQSGALTILPLDKEAIVLGDINAVFPTTQAMPLKTRVAINFLVELFCGEPVWDQVIKPPLGDLS